MIIRLEQASDIEAIRDINTSAFETETEANLVDALRSKGVPLISLVAEESERLIGHILFSPVELDNDETTHSIAGLAPMAVLPSWQGQGVGSLLVDEGLRHCKSAGYQAVAVLGHPEFYPRFSFKPSVTFNIRSEYDVPDEVFMLKELEPDVLRELSGTIKYHPLFNQA